MSASRAAAARRLASLAALVACAGDATLPPPAARAHPAPVSIVVVELAAKDADVRRFPRGRDSLGIVLAREIAAELDRLGATAEAIDAGEVWEGSARWRVEGRLVSLDGGSRIARGAYPLASGWGAARCRLEIAVGAEEEGAPGAAFSQESRARAAAWAEGGVGVGDRCLKIAAIEAARRIWRELAARDHESGEPWKHETRRTAGLGSALN
jgi:hypothetical protein